MVVRWASCDIFPHLLAREKAVFATHAHVFQIDPETKKKWLPSSSSAVRVAYYHDPGRKTYRIIAIENNKVRAETVDFSA